MFLQVKELKSQIKAKTKALQEVTEELSIARAMSQVISLYISCGALQMNLLPAETIAAAASWAILA
jgi:hypothetical protein